MTEDNIRFESDSDEAVSAPVPESGSEEQHVIDSPNPEITPLIPGTEIIGRRARRAAMMQAQSAAPEEESADQIPLWDETVTEEAADQISLWDAASMEEPPVAEDPVSAEGTVFSEEALPEEAIPVAELSAAVSPESEQDVSDPLAELFAPEPEVHLRRARGSEDPVPAPAEEADGAVEDVRLRRARVTPESVPKKRPCAVSPFVEFVEIVVGALVAAILVLTLICRTGVVEGSSMVPTMYQGDRYVISDLFYTPEQGDIVVFRPEIDGEDELWIKRVIALEGQTVYIDPNTYQVYVDGKLLDEPYLGGAGTIPHTTENPITVPEGCVYMLGDNRAISHDSRYEDLGCVEIGQLAGRVILRFWPMESFGFCE